jgi:predicted DNA-binding WGR domain protein
MDLEQAIAQAHLICVDVTENHNKFWSAWVLENGDLFVEYGRVGSTAQSKLHAIGNINTATNKMNTLVKQKQAKGYQVAANSDSKSLDYSLLPNGSVIQEEIENIQQQWQQMESFSLIRFHPDTGQFRSLSGSLSTDVVTIARSRLDQVQTHYRRGDDEFIAAVEAYIRVIPMRSTAKLNAHELLGSRLKLSQQTELLDLLEQCLNQVDRIRALIQSTLSGGDRSTWLSWGIVPEAIPTEFTDDGRAIAIHWS